MFLGYQNGKIILYTENKLNPQEYMLDGEMVETNEEYILIDGEYVLKNSEESIEYQKELRKQEILTALNELDLKSIRAIRANDTEYIQKYEEEAQALREELRNL